MLQLKTLTKATLWVFCGALLSACGGKDEPQRFTVTASAGSGGSISPGTRSVQSGQTTSFTLSVNEGYSIASVTGCNGSLSGNTYTTAAITAACSVQASFSLNSYTVSASSGEGGSISPDSAVVAHGGSTSFTVTLDNGYSLGSVTGCNGSLNGNTFTTGAITSACSIQAIFNLNSHTVTASASEGGSISPETLVVTHGAIAEFTVAAERDYTLASITGCGGSLSGSIYRTAPITSACSVAASFAKQVVTAELPEVAGNLTASVINTDEVYFHADTQGFIPVTGHTASPTQAPPAGWSFPYGLFDFTAVQRVAGGSAVIRLSYPVALPENFSYYKFGPSAVGAAPGWYVLPASHYEISADRKTLTLTIFDGQLGDSDGEINGIIRDPGGPAVQQQYSVTALAGEGGAISPGSAVVNHGGSTSFSVTPQTGFSIASVTGCNGSLSGNNYTTGAITGACSVSASFSQNSYTVSASAGEGGSISPGSATVSHGATTNFAVTPQSGYSIASVTGCNGSLSGNTYTTGAVTSACSVQASFSLNSYIVTATAGQGGSISPGSATVSHGATTSFTVTPQSGYSIASVTGCNGSLSGNTYTTGAITAACSVQASFSQNSFTVTASAGQGGGITPASRTVQSGQTTTFILSAGSGYSIASVTGCNGSLSGNTYTTGAVTSACSVQANFSLNSYSVTASTGAGGNISPGSATISHGATTSFTVTPQSGYSIASVTGCNGSLSGNTYTTGTVTSACSVQASFSLNSYAVTATAGEGGSISPGSATVSHGATTSFTVTPQSGYSIASVTGCNGSLSGNTYTTGAITAACSVTASFNQNSYMITAIGSDGGQITPGSLSVLHGQTAQFSVVADDNYRIVEVSGCGGSLDNETFTTAAITAACTINASFAFVPIGGLNDTGIAWCANNSTNNLDCPVAGFEGQDGDFGRDAKARAGTLTKIGGGAAGFDYTKIAADGSVLAIQDAAWDANGTEAAGSQWSCVRDNVTGLIWEVKTTDGGLRDMNHTYTWYNPDSNTNGGNAGVQNGGQCTGSDCDTYAFVQAVNSQGLCGATDWRMPTMLELMSIVNNGQVSPAIDTAYFPNTPSVGFWSSSPGAGSSAHAWVVPFYNGYVSNGSKTFNGRVRLVRAGQ